MRNIDGWLGCVVLVFLCLSVCRGISENELEVTVNIFNNGNYTGVNILLHTVLR